jgi:hypothetical protein
LQRPILSGRLGKWAYSLVEYDLEYEALKSMKGQVLADFIVEHHMVGMKMYAWPRKEHGSFSLMVLFAAKAGVLVVLSSHRKGQIMRCRCGENSDVQTTNPNMNLCLLD